MQSSTIAGYALPPSCADLTINSLGEVLNGHNYIGYTSSSNELGEAEIELWFRHKMIDAGLDGVAIALVEHVWALQELNDARFRLWFGSGMLRLDTEFCGFVDQTDLWSEIDDVARRLSLKVEVLHETPCLDHYSPRDGQPSDPADRPNPDKPGWFFGKDHGRLERQVALQTAWPDPMRINKSIVEGTIMVSEARRPPCR